MIPVDNRIERILVVNFGGIGDEILFFPVIQSLRESYPQARITAVVEPRCKGIMAFNPAVDEVIPFDAKGKPDLADLLGVVTKLRSRRFDLAIASGKSPVMPLLLLFAGARWRVGYAANAVSWTLSHAAPLNGKQYAADMYYDLVRGFLNVPGRPPQAAVSPGDRQWAKDFLTESGADPERPVVTLHPGTSRLSVIKGFIKSWEADRWASLAERLHQGGATVVLAGGPDDAEAIAQVQASLSFEPVNAYGKTRGLGELAALIERSNVLVAVDSAPMHLGVAVGTPTVAIFGPTDPEKLLPSGTVHQAVVVEGLACRPCLWEKRQTSCAELHCLKNLGVEQVEAAVWKAMPVGRP